MKLNALLLRCDTRTGICDIVIILLWVQRFILNLIPNELDEIDE